MNFEITHSLHRKLQHRTERLKNIDGRFLSSATKQFLFFLENELLLSGILADLEIEIASDKKTKNFHQWEDLTRTGTEKELVKISLIELKNLAYKNYGLDAFSIATNFGCQHSSNSDKAREFIFKELIQPFCDYFTEQIDSQRNVLNLLYRYKHRCEWFQRNRLLQIYNSETKKGEKLLALDLYQYLFDEGINFTIEPSSIDGAIDLISAQNSEDPLLADAKVFKENKTYICKGFGQLYSYTGKYNEPFGYLVIYNVTNKDIAFLFENSSSSIPFVNYNHKTIFFITIDLHKHSESPSKRGLIKTIEIKEEDLFQFIETDKLLNAP